MSDEYQANKTRQARYIQSHLACYGVKREASRKSGIPLSTIMSWFANDDAFCAEVKEAEDQLYEELFASGIKRAKEKSDTLAIFFLKARYPELYDDNYRKIQWEKNAEAELREKHPLPAIMVMADPKPEQPK